MCIDLGTFQLDDVLLVFIAQVLVLTNLGTFNRTLK